MAQIAKKLTELIESRRENLKLKASEVSPDFDCTVPGFAPKTGRVVIPEIYKEIKL